MDNELATRLIKARSDRGWSQADLANESGVAAAQVSRYEQGRSKPRPEVIAKLARALGVDFTWLSMGLSITNDPPPVDLFLDAELHSKLSEAAKESGRSMNAEIVNRLEKSLAQPIDLFTDLIATKARLETVRDSFKVLAQEANKQVSMLSSSNEVARIAANAAMEDFDSLAEIVQQFLDGDVRDRPAAEAEFNRLLRARQVIDEQLQKSEVPQLASFGDVIRARGKAVDPSE